MRDDLPDLLWPVLVLSEFGPAEAIRFVRWQKTVQEDLSGKAEARFIAECLDGRLTSLDRLAAHVPDARTVVRLRAEERGLIPESVANALASYPLRPAEWLVDRKMAPPGGEELDLLARAMFGVLKDGHREAVIKCLYIWSAVQAGTFSMSAETIELLRRYPNDPKTRGKSDSVVRAMWGAHKGALIYEDIGHFADAIKWARVFWGANSVTSRCMRRREFDADESDIEEGAVDLPTDTASNGEEPAPATVPDEGAHLRRLAMDLLSSYVEALETSPARLYDREQQEVHSGLVARAGRMAEEYGLLDLYRQAYYMASGVAHSEWWSIETHAMERCLNVLHGGHLVPSLSLNSGGNVNLATSWVDQLYALIRISLRILGTDARAVEDAFAWLSTESDGGPS